MKTIDVRLKDRSYTVCVGAKLDNLGLSIKKFGSFAFHPPRKVLIISHPFLKNKYGPTLSRSLTQARIESSFALIPEGEKVKNLKTVSKLYHDCVHSRLDRTSAIVALGGGVIGDIAGFVAATYLRGVSLIHVPTTLLAMVDSSIGGKVGVDLPQAKNFVGAFYQPSLVWIDPTVLKTLAPREFRNGLAEVIKYGIIADKQLFELLENRIPSEPSTLNSQLSTLIYRCAKIKADVVSKDEKEIKGLREILNFGHTIGHAIETVTKYSVYKHGEAISIGMCAAGFIAEELKLWNSAEKLKMENLIGRAGLPTKLTRSLSQTRMVEILSRDKKVISGAIRFVLPTKIGKVVVQKISTDLVIKGLKYVQP